MNNVLDNKIAICKKNDNHTSSYNISYKTSNNTEYKNNVELFTNQVIIFINELLKKKIIKTIRFYNYLHNNININNININNHN
jgi:hypothetical protein